MMFLKKVIKSSLLPILVLSSAVYPASGRTVFGIVKDKTSSLPISGAKVWILETGDSTRTNGSGVYSFPNIPDGVYTFLAGLPNYQPQILTSVNVRPFICGDVNGTGTLNVIDVAYLINYLYKAGPAPVWLNAADVNHTLNVNLLDVVYLINFFYKGGPPPSCP